MSFGARKELEIVNFTSEKYRQLTPIEIRWCLFDGDINESIEPDIEVYLCSPYI